MTEFDRISRDVDVMGGGTRLRLGCGATSEDGRADARLFLHAADAFRKRLSEETRPDDRAVNVAQAVESRGPQTATHRVAHEQGTGQGGGPGDHAQQGGEVSPPVVSQASAIETCRSHRCPYV